MRTVIKDALVAKYEGDIAKAKANIEIYLYSPVGIGDHSDVLSAIDEQISIAASAEEKLDLLNRIK